MPILAAPYEIFDIGDGESVDITVTRWERGDEIEMKATDGHTFRSSPLRLHLTAPLAPGKHPYLDVTSKRLIPQLEGLLAGVLSRLSISRATLTFTAGATWTT